MTALTTRDPDLEKAFDSIDNYVEKKLKVEITQAQQQLKDSGQQPNPSPLKRLLADRNQS